MTNLDFFRKGLLGFFCLLTLSVGAQVNDFQFKNPVSDPNASLGTGLTTGQTGKPKIVQPPHDVYHFDFRFTENKGQWEKPVQYKVNIPAGDLYLEKNRLTYLFLDESDLREVNKAHHSTDYAQSTRPITIDGHVFRVNFEGANPNPDLVREGQFADYENFFLGNDPSKWASTVLSFKKVTYEELYSGIDLQLYTDKDQIKYDFVIRPGSSPNTIQMNYEGVDKLTLQNGLLRIKTSVNELLEHIPLAYQEINGKRIPVACKYTLTGTTVGFELPDGYDKNYPLVIDPVIVFSTYSGSTSDNWGFTATYDNQGALYAGGVVSNVVGFNQFGQPILGPAGWQVTAGAFQTVWGGGFWYPNNVSTSTYYSTDIGIIKYAPATGQRVWATYIGGRHNDQPHSLVCNATGELFVMGTTRSDNYPTANNPYQNALGGAYGGNNNTVDGDIDIVLSRLNATGTALAASTYVGGAGKDGVNWRGGNNPLYLWYSDDHRGEIILDRNEQNIIVCNSTMSNNFPGISPNAFKTTIGGTQDGVIFKMPVSLSSMTWASYVGGAAFDAGFAVREASDGSIYLVGITTGNDLPRTNTVFANGQYQGAVDGFVYHINSTASAVINCIYVGTSARDNVYKIDLDANNNVYITGHTFRGSVYPSQPAVVGGIIYSQGPVNGNGKQFITKLNPTLSSIIYSTKWGTGNTAPNITITAFLVDRCENVYVCGWGGETSGLNASTTNGMETTPDALDRTTDNSDFYLLCLNRNAETIIYGSFIGANTGSGDHVDGGTSRFDKNGIVYHSACASCGSNNNDFPTTAGTWSRTKPNTASCNMASFKYDFQILKNIDAEFSFDVQTTGCAPYNAQFTNNSQFINFDAADSAAITYEWNFGDGSPLNNQRSPSHVFQNAGTYNVRLITNLPGICGTVDTIFQTINVFEPANANITLTPSPCNNRITVTNLTVGGTDFIWRWGDGNTSNQRNPGTYTYAAAGTYTVTYVVNTNSQCEQVQTRQVTVGNRPDVTFTVTQQPCNPTVTFNATYVNNAPTTVWEFGDGNTSNTLQPTHTYAAPGTYSVRVRTGTSLACPDTAVQQITIHPATVAGSVTPSQTVCLGDPIGNLNLTGQTGAVLRWEQSIDGGNTWTTITPINTTTSLTPGALTRTTRFRAVVQSANCAILNSSDANILVDQPAVPGTLTGGGTFCQGGTGTPVTLTGHTLNVVRWESAPNNQFQTITTINNVTTTLNPGAINNTICYRAVVRNGTNCPTVSPQPVCFQVDPPSQAGNATGGTTVCVGQTNTQINLTGTIVGNVIRWESAPTAQFNTVTTINNLTQTYIHAPAINAPICFRAVVQSGVCQPRNSGETCFAVDSVSNPGVVSQNQTVCEGTTNLTLSLSGNNGTVVRWESSTDNFTTVTTIVNITSTLNINTPMTVTTCFRAAVRSGQCNADFSQPACINVVPPTQPGRLPADQTLCSGRPINQLTLAAPLRGNVLRWESAANGNFAGGALTINNQTPSFTPPVITNNGTNNINVCYRAIVQNAPCLPLPSDTFCITIEPQTQPGTLGTARTVCQGQPSGNLTLTGNLGRIVRWESFTQNCNVGVVTTINNTTGVHSVANMQTTTCFRVVVQNGTCDEQNSNCVCITVDPLSEGGQVRGGGTVCEGDPAGPFQLSGQTGTVQTWQSTTNRGVNWTNIPGTAGQTTFTPGPVNVSTCYRAVVGSGVCPTDPSDTTCVTVDLPTIAGNVTGGRNACIGIETVALTLSGHRSRVLRWESAPNQNFNSGVQTITNTTTTFSAINLTQTTCFRAVVQNGVCLPRESGSTCVVIDPISVGGTLPPNQTICIGTPASALNLTGNIGNVVNWQSSTDGFAANIVDIPNITTSLNPGVLTQTTCYRAVVRSGRCTAASSSVSCVNVDPLTIPGNLGSPQTICSGTNANALILTGNNGTVVRWESSVNGGQAWTPINTVSNQFIPTNVLVNTCFRVAVQNGTCPIDFSNPVCIQADPTTIGGTLSGAGTVCEGNIGPLLTLSGERGTIQRWELSTDNFATVTTFTNPANTFRPLNMTASTCYRVWVKSGVCPEDVSSQTCIQVDRPSVPGIMRGDVALCNGAGSNTLELTGHRTNILRWERAIDCDNGPWTTINATTNTLTTGNLTKTTCFRAWVQNGVCPPVVTNNAVIRVSNPIVSVVSYIINNNCFGERIGAIGLFVTGGTSPYQFFWSDGGRTEDRENLPAGDYTLSVTDAQNCTAVFEYRVTQPPLLENRVSFIDNVTCFGGRNGRIGMDIIGGTPPYNVQWFTPDRQVIGTEDLDDMPAGVYRMVATDAKQCRTTRTVTITEPEPIRTQITIKPLGACRYSATVFPSGGLEPYTYLWSNGVTTQTADNLNLGEGYTVAVTDAKGCLIRANIETGYPPIKVITNVQRNVSCYDGSDGQIGITVEGGTPEYAYQWASTTDPNFSRISQNLDRIKAGIYQLTITDAKGCVTLREWAITQPDAPLTVQVLRTKNVSCNGLSDAMADITVSGGTPPYSYRWLNGSTEQDLINVPAGQYSVTVTDKNDCQVVQNFNLTQPGPMAAELTFNRPVSCFGLSDGSIAYQVLGGTPPYTYLWSNNAITEDIEFLPAGNYTMTATDANGCKLVLNQTVTQPAQLAVTLNRAVPTSCANSKDGSLTVNIIGGTAPHKIKWSDGSENPIINDVGQGNYTVQVTDAKGCAATAVFAVTGPRELALRRIIKNNPTCFGLNNGSLMYQPFGGTGPYFYKWNKGAETVSTQMNLSGAGVGVYVLTVIDKNNCTISVVDSLTAPPAFNITLTKLKDVTCYGGNDGAASVSMSGGKTPYQIRWADNTVGNENRSLFFGFQSVTVTDAGGCIQIGTVKIEQPPKLIVKLSRTVPVLCKGGNNGSINLAIEDGTPPYTYKWSNNQTEPSATGLKAGLYSVTVTDAKGCASSLNEVMITEPEAPLSTSLSFIKGETCFGDRDGAVGIDTRGGTRPYRYAWSNGNGNEDLSAVPAGEYSLLVTDANGCQVSENYVVPGPVRALEIRLDYLNQPKCFDSKDGSIAIDVLGGVQPYKYEWSTGDTIEDITGLASGVYRLTLRDANNCTFTRIFTVPGREPIRMQVKETKAAGCTPTGSADIMVSGGVPPYLYNWSNGSQSEDLEGADAGDHMVLVTDAVGCSVAFRVTIPGQPKLTAQAVIVKELTCFNSFDAIVEVRVTGGSGVYSYLWGNGATTRTINNAISGPNSVIVFDRNGCTVQASVTVTAPPRMRIINSFINRPRCVGSNDGAIGISMQGGVPPYTYNWSNGNTDDDLLNVAGGNYSLTVTDSRGCRETASFTITEPTALSINLQSVTHVSCAGQKDGRIAVVGFGGTPPYRYVWNQNAGNRNVAQNLAGGTYSVTVLDGSNCMSVATYTVNEPRPLELRLVSSTPANCANSNSGRIDIQTIGGTAPYTYLWSNARRTEDNNNIPAGTYTVSVTDARGCRTTGSFTVERITVLSARITFSRDTVCVSGATVNLSGNPSNGTFTGTGVTGRTFNPQVAGIGSHVIRYSGRVGDCTFATEKTITVIGLPAGGEINVGGLNEFCTSDGGTYPLTVSPAQPGVTSTFTGRGINRTGGRFLFSPAQAGAGTHVITGTLTDRFGCSRTINKTIVVGAPQIIRVSASESNLCSGQSAILTASGGTVYTWLPTEGISSLTGSTVTVNPQKTTTYTVTGINGGCRQNATITVNVREVFPITLTSSAASICEGRTAIMGISSRTNYNYTWSPASAVNNPNGTLVIANPTQTTTFTVTGVSGNCTTTATITLTVNRANFGVRASKPVVCAGESVTLIAGSGDPGGSGSQTFSWSPSEGLDKTVGNSVTATPARTMTYTVTGSGGTACNSRTITVSVAPAPEGLSFTGLPEKMCLTAAAVGLTGSPAGGTFEGPGISGNMFNPQIAGNGTHIITYRYTNPASGCVHSVSRNVVVGSAQVMIMNLREDYCLIAAPVTLSGVPEGGTFAGNGISGSVFSPQEAGLGTHVISYQGISPEGCAYRVVRTIRVVSTEGVISGLNARYCVSARTVMLSGLPSGGQFIGNGVVGNTFSPALAGVGTHTITYYGTDGPCTYSRTAVVTVDIGVNISTTSSNPTCATCSDGSIRVTGTGGTPPYRYRLNNGAFGSNDLFSNLSAGTYTLTVEDASGCSSNMTIILTAPISENSCVAPVNVQVIPGAGSALVSWNPVPGAVRYQVNWLEEGTNISRTANVLTGTTFNIRALTAGMRYNVRVRAICGTIASPFTVPIGFTLPAGRMNAEEMTDFEVSLYPNPNKGIFTLRLQSVEGNAPEIKIFDLQGKELYRTTVQVKEHNEEIPLALENILSSGVYQLQVSYSGTNKTLKLVIE